MVSTEGLAVVTKQNEFSMGNQAVPPGFLLTLEMSQRCGTVQIRADNAL